MPQLKACLAMVDPAVGAWEEPADAHTRRDLATRMWGAPLEKPTLDHPLTIRRYVQDDRAWAAELLKVNSVPEYDHLRIDDILWMLDQVHPALLVAALVGSKPAALFGARPEGPSLHLLFMDVAAWAQGKGLGGWAIQALQWHAADVGRPIVAEVYVHNQRAVRFYQRHGFQIRGIVKDYYEDGLDAYAIQWKPSQRAD